MNKLNRWALAVAGVFVAACGTIRAEDASLNLVPAQAPIVVQVNGYEKARGHLGQFLGNALPDMAPKLAKQLDDAIKEAATGRDLKAIAKDGRIYFAVAELTNLESPQAALFIPVTSYAEFKKTFLKEDELKSLKKEDGVESFKMEGHDDPFYLVDRKDYVIGSNDQDLAKSLAKGGESGLGKELAAETKAAFLAQDVAVYVNLKAINKQYGNQIKGFKSLLELGLQGGGGMGIDKKQIEMAKTIINALLSLFDDGVAAVLGFEFRNEGANLHFLAQFGDKTDTNSFLKMFQPAGLKQLGTLPTGQLFYAATNFDASKSKTLSALMRDSLADDEDEKAKEAIQSALKQLSENTRTVEISSMRSLGSALEVSEYKDGPGAVAATLKVFQALSKGGSFGGVPLKQKPVITENAETVGDLKLNHVKLAFDFDKAVENLPEAARESARSSMMKMAGEKVNIWFGNSGNKVIQVTGKDWKEAKATLEEYLQGSNTVGSDDSFQVTRKNLPADANFLILGDTARFIEMGLGLVKDATANVPGLPIGGIPDLKAPKGKPAYFGVSLILKSEYVSFDLFVPVTAVQQVRKMFAPLLQGDN